jgi:preprotein translocase subunit SecE
MAKGMTKKILSKKNGAADKEEGASFSPRVIKGFINEVKVEFTKIVWPDRKVTLTLTGVVAVLSIIVAAYLGTVDLLIGKLVASFLQ